MTSVGTGEICAQGSGRWLSGLEVLWAGRKTGEIPVLIRKPETRNRKGAVENYGDGGTCKIC